MAFVLALGVVVLFVPSLASAQCAMCRSALESSAEGRAIGSSLNHAILLLLAAPYLLAGTFAVLLFRRQVAQRLRRWRTRALELVPLTGWR